jgi:hypothetical protein
MDLIPTQGHNNALAVHRRIPVSLIHGRMGELTGLLAVLRTKTVWNLTILHGNRNGTPEAVSLGAARTPRASPATASPRTEGERDAARRLLGAGVR